jgi:hypothetical protein
LSATVTPNLMAPGEACAVCVTAASAAMEQRNERRVARVTFALLRMRLRSRERPSASGYENIRGIIMVIAAISSVSADSG